MTCRHGTLDAAILDAFRRALHENRMEAAEHLLRALEALDRERHGGTILRRAYLAITERPGIRRH